MDDNEQIKPEDLDEREAAVLPARVAMSLIAPDTGTPDFPASGEQTASDQGQSKHTSSEDSQT